MYTKQNVPVPIQVDVRLFGLALNVYAEAQFLTPAKRCFLRILYWCYVREADQTNIYGRGRMRTPKQMARFLYNCFVMVSASEGSRELDALRMEYEHNTSFIFVRPAQLDPFGRQMGSTATRVEFYRQYAALLPILIPNETVRILVQQILLKRYAQSLVYKGGRRGRTSRR